MEITEKVLNKIISKTWEKLEENCIGEEEWIKHRNTSVYAVNQPLAQYRYLLNINLLKELKEVLVDDEITITYYGLKDFETEENDVFVPLLKYDEVKPLPDEEALIVLKSEDGRKHYISLTTFMIIFKELFKKDILNLTSVINSKTNCNTITIECREDE